MTLRCMIVDDDPMARQMLKNLCEADERVLLQASCANAEEALEALSEQPVDLLFLDVEMPGLSGLELLEKLPFRPQVIITTVNKDYAFEAFEYQVADFLHKPVSMVRFTRALDRAWLLHEGPTRHRTNPDHFYIRVNSQYLRLEVNEIQYFENIGDYVRIATPSGPHLVHSTLKAIDEKLNDRRFLRVHRSYIVNLDKIKDIQENTLVIGREVIPVSRANRPVLMQRINIL